MKYFILLSFLFLAGCKSKTEFGECIGAFDDGDPKLNYKLSVRNLVLGVVFIELIVPPIIIVAEKTRCPESFK